MDESLDLTHILLSQIHLFRRQFDESIKAGERAIELNPNGAGAHLNLGFILCLSGKTELGIKLQERAFRLNPLPPPHHYATLAVAYRNNEQYEKAIEFAEKCIVDSPDDLIAHLVLASSFIFLNCVEEAHNAAEKILRINPNFSVHNWGMTMPYKDQDTIDRLMEVFRKAGLPD